MGVSRSGRSRKNRKRRTGAGGSKVRIKGHTRNPRGSDRGKKPVYVKGHRRKPPR